MKISVKTVAFGLILIGLSLWIQDSNWLTSMKLVTITFCFGMWLMALLDDNQGSHKSDCKNSGG